MLLKTTKRSSSARRDYIYNIYIYIYIYIYYIPEGKLNISIEGIEMVNIWVNIKDYFPLELIKTILMAENKKT